MSEQLQGHRTKLNANKMTCDRTCSSRWKQPVFNSFSRTVQTSGVAWTWAATLTPWRILADCSTLAPRPRERHGRRQWTAMMEERREQVLMPSTGAATYRGRRHAGSRWRGTVAQCQWWGVGVMICLERGADCHCHTKTPPSLASFKSRLVLPFWH